jgi:hypothetical protein
MIPAFNEHGYLPPGVHAARLDEIERRFGRATKARRELMECFGWLLDMVRKDDVVRVIVDGSFVTSKPRPVDVDCVILMGPTFATHDISIHEWKTPLPCVHVEIADPPILNRYVSEIFAFDRWGRPKGMTELIL